MQQKQKRISKISITQVNGKTASTANCQLNFYLFFYRRQNRGTVDCSFTDHKTWHEISKSLKFRMIPSGWLAGFVYVFNMQVYGETSAATKF
jgi:hypothetical protein